MSATPEEEDGPLDPQRGRATLSFGKWNREIQSLRPLRGHLPLHKGGFTGAVSPGSVGCRGAFQLPAGKSASGPRRFFSGTARRHHLFLKKRWWGRPSPTRSVGSPSRAVRGMYSAWKRFFKKCGLWAQGKVWPRAVRGNHLRPGAATHIPRFCADEKALFSRSSPPQKRVKLQAFTKTAVGPFFCFT